MKLDIYDCFYLGGGIRFGDDLGDTFPVDQTPLIKLDALAKSSEVAFGGCAIFENPATAFINPCTRPPPLVLLPKEDIP